MIVSQDLEQVSVSNLYDAVVRLRPEWLSARATGTAGQRSGLTQNSNADILVYLDAQRAGTADFLKTMTLRGIAAVRYYSASDAQAHFGSGNLNGVIQVVTTAK